MVAGLIGGQNANTVGTIQSPTSVVAEGSGTDSWQLLPRLVPGASRVDESPPSVLPNLPPVTTLPTVEPAAPNSIEGIICTRFGSANCGYWIQVGMCESSLNPYAVGYGGVFVGLFQVWTAHGYGYDWLLDPYNNTLAAWELSDGGKNTASWPYCRWQ